MTGLDVVDRARSQVGLGTIYVLGRGGYLPGAATAHDTKKRCDCSGFAAWCHAESRKIDMKWYKDFNGGWFETTAIFRDLSVPYGMFEPASVPLPGMAIVWGDRGGKQGHMGIISRVSLSGVIESVIHCSRGNYNKLGDAIAETAPDIFFKNGALVAVRAGIEYGA